MKQVFRLLLILGAVTTVLVDCQAKELGDKLYGGRVIIDADTNIVSRVWATEFTNWLGKVTGKQFQIGSTMTNAAIFLLRTNSDLVAAADVARLKGKGPEGFVIRSDGGEQMWIVGNTGIALQDAVFFYLDQLGCRWFLPNDHWTIIPHRDSIALKIDRVESPAFRGRTFFGTGGYGGKGRMPVDQNLTMINRWNEWRMRNNLSGSIFVGGHTGEAFNTKYKAVLMKHPEYFAEINGKRPGWSLGAKPCVSNPDMVKLYVEDRVNAFKWSAGQPEDNPYAFAISVEPADGGGYCTCEKCRALGTPSDQMIYLANQVAKALDAVAPGKKVSLLGYAEHADVPKIPIEPNVYVMVVPYAFQRTGMTAEELIDGWGQKVKEMGLYDYWACTDWALCLPSLSFRDTVPAKIRYWHAHSVDAFFGESSSSAGAVGLVWYTASRLLWNPATDEKALFDDFYEKSFGPAAGPMRRMLDRWNDGFTLTANEIAYSMRDIQAARALATDDAIRARVDDYALYVEYIRLWYEFRNSAGASHEQAERKVLEYVWRIYDSAMVHSYRMHTMLDYKIEGHPAWIDQDWPMANPAATGWAHLKPVTRDEIGEMIESGVKQYVPVEYDRHVYSTKLVPLTPQATRTNLTGQLMASPRLIADCLFNFWAPEGIKQVELQVRCGPRVATSQSPHDRAIIYDAGTNIILRQTIEADGAYHTVTIPTPKPGLYRMYVMDQKLGFNVQFPADLPFTSGGFINQVPGTRMYFFVPKGQKQLAMEVDSGQGSELLDGDGKRVGDKFSGFLIRDVPEGQDGRVWSIKLDKVYPPFRALNFPSQFAFRPDALVVPEEVSDAKRRD